jgi:hypothetical protein
MKKLLIIVLASIFLISACGPEPEPTMSAEEVQGTAVAAAWTMVAETQAAIPTATPIPPTEIPSATPPPTNTVAPLVLPTQPLAVQPTATTASSADECDKFLGDAAGPTAPIKLVNETKAPMNVSLYLEKTPFGECGYRGYSVPKKGSIVVDFPQGVMYAYAWILEPVNTTVSGGPWKPNNTDKWEIQINENVMKMVGP